MKVTFRNYKGGRVWEAIFDCGSDDENAYTALTVAWKHNAEIVRTDN